MISTSCRKRSMVIFCGDAADGLSFHPPGEQSGVCPDGEVRGVSVRLPMVHFSHGQLHLSSGDRQHSSRSVGSWVSWYWIVDEIDDPAATVIDSSFRPDTATPWHHMPVDNIKPHMVPFVFLVPQCVSVLASGRLLDLGYARGIRSSRCHVPSGTMRGKIAPSCTRGGAHRRCPGTLQFIKVSGLLAFPGRQERSLPLAGTAR